MQDNIGEVKKKKKRGALGKGVDSIIIPSREKKSSDEGGLNERADKKEEGEWMVRTALVEPNMNQPRKEFNKEELEELTESIKQYGVLQPIIVKRKGNAYEIIAGERRWRAAQAAGLKEIPVIIREYTDQEAMEISIIENIQRADLNPIEEARAYRSLMEEYGLKHEEIALKVSKNRTTITNSLRLLKLDESIQILMIEGKISSGHARALLSVENKEDQIKLAEEIIKKGLNVREVERLVKALGRKKKEKTKEEESERDISIFYKKFEDRIRDIFSTKVHINRKDKNKGRIEIEYYSQAELERIMDLIRSIES